ncbi:MAG TPA: PSD1 and planctomycete cytochrome C domain-containing protein [Pirellulaceae bacterium]|nr:PSD1 and planctomycete cytochrome C domain-containing protein [Pirellulaceae bacterium]
MNSVRIFAAALLPLVSVCAASAAEIDFPRDIQPILGRHCAKCHIEKREGGLRLASRKDALVAADSGEVVIKPGDGAASELIRRVTAEDDTRMPPEGERLSADEVALVKRWIDDGAKWPDNSRAKRHWSYAKPVRSPLPAITRPDWPKTFVDAWILARLDREKLSPSPEASPSSLLRRLSLDLRGLPPPLSEADAFLADESPDAYERQADRYFASPAFGERWARHWLDLARYADSNGFQRDGFRELWAWRDWVVAAMNADLPFDQFTIEQLAGDLLPDATVEQKIATGFHRCTTVNVEAGTDQEENRVNQVVDRVNTTGAVWLGSTLECAQCHNHKYDPIAQQEYYQLFAYFNNTPIETAFRGKNATAAIDFTGPMMEVASEAIAEQRQRLRTKLAEIDSLLAAAKENSPPISPEWEGEQLANAEKSGQWHVLSPASFASEGKATGTILDDQSILVGGPVPAKDTYTVTLKTDLPEITGLKLETLTDPSLPGMGPGRGDEQRPNFVLHKFSVAVEINGEPGPAVKFKSAAADFSQKGYAVAGAIDDDPKTGWGINPQFGQPHEATFLLAEPIRGEGAELIVKLEQNLGAGRTIGRLRLSAITGNPDAAVPPDVVTILKTAAGGRSAADAKRLNDYRLSLDPQVQSLKEEREAAAKALGELTAPQTLVMQDMSEPRTTRIFRRGDFLQPLAEVKPQTPSFLHAPLDGPPNRLTLARWLASPENPLVGRVTVNRWWAELFGRGIVSTPEDFGIQGEPPTHGELLDALAIELIESGWSMKTVLRRIVGSATYRQASKLTPELRARDDQNRLYARGPRIRLDAETIRDNALAMAGLLSLKQGGPPVKPPQPEGVWTVTGLVDNSYKTSPGEDAYRRGIYVVWRRSAPYPSFMNFDASIRATCTVNRSRSNTPLAALTLLNDPVYVEAAEALARRIVAEAPSIADDSRIRQGFMLALCREPTAAELSAVVKLLSESRERHGNSEQAVWQELATVLLNLDETITK